MNETDTDGVFNMEALADELTALGLPSFVAMTGGGVATIYGGECQGDTYELCAGSGTFKHRDYGYSVAYFADFYYGPDGEEEVDTFIAVGQVKPLPDLAREIVEWLREYQKGKA